MVVRMDRLPATIGGLLIVAGGILGRETFVWGLGKILDSLSRFVGSATMMESGIGWLDALGLLLALAGVFVLAVSMRSNREKGEGKPDLAETAQGDGLVSTGVLRGAIPFEMEHIFVGRPQVDTNELPRTGQLILFADCFNGSDSTIMLEGLNGYVTVEEADAQLVSSLRSIERVKERKRFRIVIYIYLPPKLAAKIVALRDTEGVFFRMNELSINLVNMRRPEQKHLLLLTGGIRITRDCEAYHIRPFDVVRSGGLTVSYGR